MPEKQPIPLRNTRTAEHILFDYWGKAEAAKARYNSAVQRINSFNADTPMYIRIPSEAEKEKAQSEFALMELRLKEFLQLCEDGDIADADMDNRQRGKRRLKGEGGERRSPKRDREREIMNTLGNCEDTTIDNSNLEALKSLLMVRKELMSSYRYLKMKSYDRILNWRRKHEHEQLINEQMCWYTQRLLEGYTGKWASTELEREMSILTFVFMTRLMEGLKGMKKKCVEKKICLRTVLESILAQERSCFLLVRDIMNIEGLTPGEAPLLLERWKDENQKFNPISRSPQFNIDDYNRQETT